MSGPRFSIIPAWIVTDPRLKGRDLQVLCVLGRHVDEHGWCTRSQVKLASQLGCARSTVQLSLNRLKDIGVLQMRENETPDGRDCSHDYRILFDAEIVPQTLSDAVGESDENGHQPPADRSAPPADISAPPADPGSAPYKNVPLKNEERERAGARADESGNEGRGAGQHPLDDPRRAEALFWKAFKVWPRFDPSPKRPMLAAWDKLTGAEREQAADAVPRYLAGCKREGINHPPAIATYLGEALWKSYPPEKEPEKPKPTTAEVRPFGPLWAALRMRALLAGPVDMEAPGDLRAKVVGTFESLRGTVSDGGKGYLSRMGLELDAAGDIVFPADFELRQLARMRITQGFPGVNGLDDKARHCQGDWTPIENAHLADLCEPVPTESETYAEWRAEHARNDWPWIPDPGRMRVVYFPKGGPDGLEAFRAAVHGGDGDQHRQEAAE